jgi:hypothetical protein
LRCSPLPTQQRAGAEQITGSGSDLHTIPGANGSADAARFDDGPNSLMTQAESGFGTNPFPP